MNECNKLYLYLSEIGSDQDVQDEWINKLWYIQTVEYCWAKRNELSIHAKRYMNLKCILLMKEAYLKRLWLHLYDILEKAETRGGEQMGGCLGFRGKEQVV